MRITAPALSPTQTASPVDTMPPICANARAVPSSIGWRTAVLQDLDAGRDPGHLGPVDGIEPDDVAADGVGDPHGVGIDRDRRTTRAPIARATISPVSAVEAHELSCERRDPDLVGRPDEVRVACRSTGNVSTVAPTNVESGAGIVVAVGAAVAGRRAGVIASPLVWSRGPVSGRASRLARCSSMAIRRRVAPGRARPRRRRRPAPRPRPATR